MVRLRSEALSNVSRMYFFNGYVVIVPAILLKLAYDRPIINLVPKILISKFRPWSLFFILIVPSMQYTRILAL